MDSSLKEEIEGRINEVLSQIGTSYNIDFKPANSEGEGSDSYFRIIFEYDSLYEGLYDDVERVLKNSKICAEFGLNYLWEDRDLCICTDGWDR